MSSIHPKTLSWLEYDIQDNCKGYLNRIETFLTSRQTETETDIMFFRKTDGGEAVEVFASFCTDEEEVSVLSPPELLALVKELAASANGLPKALSVHERQDRSRKGKRRV